MSIVMSSAPDLPVDTSASTPIREIFFLAAVRCRLSRMMQGAEHDAEQARKKRV
jgi:hypothetical protein